MKLFNFKKRSIEANQDITDDLLLKSILSENTIGKAEALNIPAVARCVNLISDTVSMIPIKLYKEKMVNGKRKTVEIEDSRCDLFNLDTKDTLDGVQFKKALVRDYLLDGNAYAYINKRRNLVKSLHYVDCDHVLINQNFDPIFKDYNIMVYGKTYKPYEFLKILKVTRNGARGIGIIEENQELLKAAYLTLKFEQSLVSTGGSKKGFIKAEKKITKEAMDSLKRAWRELYCNTENNVIVLNDNLDFKEASSTSTEMQLNENKTVNIDATSINAATPEQGAKADSAIQGIQGNGTTIAPNANKIVNITPSNIGAVSTSRTVNGKALSSNISLTASDVGAAASSHGNHVPTVQTASNKIFLRNDNTWQTVTPSNIGAAASSHNHSASNITSGTLPISRGGTGATSASSALSNLGVTISSGSWTPTIASRNGTNPTYSVYYKYARYYRINNLVYITFHMKVNISNQGTDYACVKGLPFTASNNMNSQSLALHECYGGIDQRPATANICDSSSIIYLQNSSGECALQWRTGDTWVGFSGCYMKA